MGQLFGYLFEHQKTEVIQFFMFLKRLTHKQSNCLLKYLCKKSYGCGYSAYELYVLLQVYFKESSNLVFKQPLTLNSTQPPLKML